MKIKLLILTMIFSFLFSLSLSANDISKVIVPTKHNKELTISDIAKIQPGLGVVMMEFGHRFYIVYYAAKAKNWKLAEYELNELIEAQEVVEITRPKYKDALKKFENDYLKRLLSTIKAQNWKNFITIYELTTKACNSCHIKTGHPYIQYKLPKTPPLFLDLRAGVEL